MKVDCRLAGLIILIGAETPAEISVSILAEIIKARRPSPATV
jgi:xanthine/CO dehydrogenase XdhC/CoxF family maturation factor